MCGKVLISENLEKRWDDTSKAKAVTNQNQLQKQLERKKEQIQTESERKDGLFLLLKLLGSGFIFT